MREGSLEAPTRHPLDWKNPAFWDQAKYFGRERDLADIMGEDVD